MLLPELTMHRFFKMDNVSCFIIFNTFQLFKNKICITAITMVCFCSIYVVSGHQRPYCPIFFDRIGHFQMLPILFVLFLFYQFASYEIIRNANAQQTNSAVINQDLLSCLLHTSCVGTLPFWLHVLII